MCIVALIQTRNNSGLKHLEHGLFSEGEAQDKSDSLKKTYLLCLLSRCFFFNFFFLDGLVRLFQSETVHYALYRSAVLHFCITPINQSDKVFNERQLEC